MSHRVIAGSAKGRRLQLVPGKSTRPITDRVKESLFNILGTDVADSRFLDLFAGTGAVGIEALSRGASHARFCDMERLAIKTIRANLAHTGLIDRADVKRMDALAMLKARAPESAFDFIYIAPPQYQGIWIEVIKLLDANLPWIPDGTTAIVQIDPKEYQSVPLRYLEVADQRTYGKTMLLFYERKSIPVDKMTDKHG